MRHDFLLCRDFPCRDNIPSGCATRRRRVSSRCAAARHPLRVDSTGAAGNRRRREALGDFRTAPGFAIPATFGMGLQAQSGNDPIRFRHALPLSSGRQPAHRQPAYRSPVRTIRPFGPYARTYSPVDWSMRPYRPYAGICQTPGESLLHDNLTKATGKRRIMPDRGHWARKPAWGIGGGGRDCGPELRGKGSRVKGIQDSESSWGQAAARENPDLAPSRQEPKPLLMPASEAAPLQAETLPARHAEQPAGCVDAVAVPIRRDDPGGPSDTGRLREKPGAQDRRAASKRRRNGTGHRIAARRPCQRSQGTRDGSGRRHRRRPGEARPFAFGPSHEGPCSARMARLHPFPDRQRGSAFVCLAGP